MLTAIKNFAARLTGDMHFDLNELCHRHGLPPVDVRAALDAAGIKPRRTLPDGTTHYRFKDMGRAMLAIQAKLGPPRYCLPKSAIPSDLFDPAK